MTGHDGTGQGSRVFPCCRWADEIRDSVLVGVCAGVAYFLAALVAFFPREEMRLIGSGLLKANLFAYSLAVWVCGFTVLAAAVQIMTLPVSRRFSARRRPGLRRFILLLVVIAVVVAGHAVWAYYVRVPPFRPRHILLGDLRLVLLGVGAGSALAALAVSLALGSSRISRLLGGRSSARPAIAIVGLCAAYAIVANVVGAATHRWDRSGGVITQGRGRVVMLGIDSGSWNAMLPLLERGELPGFKRLMEEGSYGYLDAYGIVGNVLTPPSWTTIATGKTMEKHGISRFGQLSSEWRAAPVWTVLSQAGRAVGVVNWVCAWPPFKVKGVFISNPSPSRVGRLYLSPGLDAFAAAADSAITAAYRAGSDAGEAAADADEPGMGFLTRADITRSAESEIGFLWRIEREVISRQPPDFISYYYYAPDMVQHRFSKGLDRAEARGVGGGGMDDGSGGAGGSGRWGDGRPDRAGDDPVRWVWMAADSFLTDLMAGYGDDAWYLVVSDHGSREVLSGTAVFEMNALLVEMGCLKMAGGEIDSSASTCFLTAARAAYSKFHLKVNPSGGRANLPDRAGSLEETVSRIAGELRSIRVKETGHPIFERVDVSSEPGSADQPDIVAVAGKTILEMPKQETIVVVGAKEIDLRSLLIPHPWTAQHRARGIILAKGPGIRRHYSGAWTIADPYACIYPYLRGAVPATAWIGRVLRWLRVLDPATTLDVAPTLLYLLDLPVARDMDGRVLTELIDAQVLTARSVREVATYGVGTVADVDTSTVDREEVKKALKALGYLQ